MPRGGPRQPSSTRAALLGAARALFAERGFGGASTREIAQRARAPQGLVRHHFGGKEGLWREVVMSELAELDARAPEQRELPALAAAWGDAWGAHPELVSLIGHALFEPGARRTWLISRLNASASVTGLVARVHAARGAAPSADAGALIAARTIVIGALPLIALAARALRVPTADAAAFARVQHDVWSAVLAQGRPAQAAGPWSLEAAARRRAQAQHERARAARDS